MGIQEDLHSMMLADLVKSILVGGRKECQTAVERIDQNLKELDGFKPSGDLMADVALLEKMLSPIPAINDASRRRMAHATEGALGLQMMLGTQIKCDSQCETCTRKQVNACKIPNPQDLVGKVIEVLVKDGKIVEVNGTHSPDEPQEPRGVDMPWSVN